MEDENTNTELYSATMVLTAYVDEKDNLQFRPDIYNLDKLKKYPLYLPKDSE